MKPTWLYRTASGLLFLWCVGNTYGLLMFWHVAGSMSPVRFPVGHSGFSYAQVVLGYEVFCSFCVLFAAYLACTMLCASLIVAFVLHQPGEAPFPRCWHRLDESE